MWKYHIPDPYVRFRFKPTNLKYTVLAEKQLVYVTQKISRDSKQARSTLQRRGKQTLDPFVLNEITLKEDYRKTHKVLHQSSEVEGEQ